MSFLTSLSPMISAHNSRVSFHPLGRKKDFSVAWKGTYLSCAPPTLTPVHSFSVFPFLVMAKLFKTKLLWLSSGRSRGRDYTGHWGSLLCLSSPSSHSLLYRSSYPSLHAHVTQCVPPGLTYLLPSSLSQVNEIGHLIESLVHVYLTSYWNVNSLGAGATLFSSDYLSG